MNILMVSYYEIFPITGGSSIAQFGTIEYLSRICNLSIIIPANFTPTKEDLVEMRYKLPRVKIYTLGKVLGAKKSKFMQTFPSPKRFNHAIKTLKEFKQKITSFSVFSKNRNHVFSCANIENNFLDVYPLKAYSPHDKETIEAINDIILKDSIDIVQLEFDENLNLVAALSDKVIKVFVEHECRFSRIKSHIEAKGLNTAFYQYIYDYYKAIELSFLAKYDGIISFTKADSEELEKNLSDRENKLNFCISPFAILDENFIDLQIENFIRPSKLVFVGYEEHYPNKDALEWFLESTATEIYESFGLRLCVIGKWSENTIEKYRNHSSRVYFTGFVEDLYSYMKHSISIVPIRMGRGLRSKTLLSMAQGVPVITTQHALEGIEANHHENVMIANEGRAFVASTEYLLSDLNIAFSICKNAQKLARENFSQSVVAKARLDFYKHLIKEKELKASKKHI